MHPTGSLSVTCLFVLFAATPVVCQVDRSHPRLAAHAKHLAMAKSSPHATHAWQFVGPVKMTGRLTDIEVHPSQPKTIYIASASGGVFKTIDEGESWKPIFDLRTLSTQSR